MTSDLNEEGSSLDLPLSPKQKQCARDLIERLRQVTLKIEELDTREEKIIGDTEVSDDQRRAINISRVVFVNEQKDLERKLSDVINSCPEEEPPASTPPSIQTPTQLPSPPPIQIPSSLPILTPTRKPAPNDPIPALAPTQKHSTPGPNPETNRNEPKSQELTLETIQLRRTNRSRPDPAPQKQHADTGSELELELHPTTPPVVLSEKSPSPRRSRRKKSTDTVPGSKKSNFTYNVLSFKICPICSARLPANFRICGRCGTRLENSCPHCSATVPEGISFCGKCGKQI